MAMLTPHQDPRRLSFGTNALSNYSNPSPSPYTPFSRGARREALGGTRISSPFSRSNALAHQNHTQQTPEPSEEAETFVSGGLKSQLRNTSLLAVSIARKAVQKRTPQQVGLSFATYIIDQTNTLFSLSESLFAAPTIRPSTRRQVAHLREQLLLELRTWMLLQSAWTVPQRRADDLLTKRLRLSTRDMLRLLNIPGVVKVQHAIEWLEQAANDDLKRAGGPLVHPLDDPAYRWRYTADKFEGEPVSMDFPLRGVAGGMHVDLDAVGDVEDPLDEIERKGEARLAREVFRLVRAGQLEEAERVCRAAGQPWRATTLAGGRNASALASNGVVGSARTVWRRAAKALATTSRTAVPLHERAVAGILSGELQPVLAVCSSHDDQLWARLNVLLDSTVEKMLAQQTSSTSSVTTTAKQLLDCPQDAVIADDTILQTFHECTFSVTESETSTSSIHIDVLTALRRVQAFLSLGSDISEDHRITLFDAIAQFAKSAVEHKMEWACRLAALISLFLKFSGVMETGNDHMLKQFDYIIQQYVQFVIDAHDANCESHQNPLLRTDMDERASVCSISASFLAEMNSMSIAIATYSKMMHAALRADLLQEAMEARRAKVAPQNIEERRVLCLEEAGHCFPTSVLSDLTKHVVDAVWAENMDLSSSSAGVLITGTPTPNSDRRRSSLMSSDRRLTIGQNTATPGGVGVRMDAAGAKSLSSGPDKDEMVIRAIEFLTYSAYPNYEEALIRTTCAARRFFLAQKREIARRLILWFPRDVLDSIDQKSYGGYTREYHCWELYFRAVTQHNDWHVYKTTNQPRPLPDSVRHAALAQPVQKEAKDRLRIYNATVHEYEKGCEELRAVAMTSLFDTLLYDSGWMKTVDANIVVSNDSDNEALDGIAISRHDELDKVRKLGIPEIVSLLHHLFHKSGLYKDAADMIALVAREEFKLYQYYQPKEMRALLAKVADSTIRLADETVIMNDLAAPYEGTFFEDFNGKSARENNRVTFAEP